MSSRNTLADTVHHLPVPPEVVGLTVFLVFCILIVALLMFGKGRPHA